MLDVCPRCHHAWEPALALNMGPSEFWRQCSNPGCNSYYNTYVPQAHQDAFHRDDHRFVGNFGGYGSGKTLTSREEFYKHLFITPAGNTLIGANVASQYEQTIKRDIENDLPMPFIRHVNTQKQYIDFINSHRLMFRPYDDPDKLRSYNLSMFLIVEGSEVKKESFTQLKTRARNLAATTALKDSEGFTVYKRAANGVDIPVIDKSWIKGIIESNPSAGWIRDDVLLVAADIFKHGKILDEFEVDPALADPSTSAHITSTSANEFLPPDFIAQNTKNKPLWWVNRFIYGSFLYAEGLVYPDALRCIVDDFDFPPEWKRIIAFDYGLSDDAVFLYGAIDEIKGIVYIYKEIRVNNKNVEELSRIFKDSIVDIPIGGLLGAPLIDPKSALKRDYDKKTLADHFRDNGIIFKPGAINVDARVFRLNTYFISGKLKIFRSCTGLNRELVNYKFKSDETLVSGFTGKPVDKNNHGINALEWIVMDLPSDPKNLLYGVFNRAGEDLTQHQDPVKAAAYWALSDDNELTTNRSMPFDMEVDYNYGYNAAY
jgi:Phage terminase large subunit